MKRTLKRLPLTIVLIVSMILTAISALAAVGDTTVTNAYDSASAYGETVSIWAFGGQMFGSFNMLETLKELVQTGTGKDVFINSTFLSHNNGSTTYNAYELFASSARSSLTDFTFASDRVALELNNNSYDYVLIQTGRDFSLVSGSSAYTNNPIAAAKIAKLAYENNPDVKIILVAPYGHQATFGDFTNPAITDHSTHVTHINAEAERTKELILENGYAKNVEIVSIGSLLESYSTSAATIKTDLFRAADTETTRKNVGNRANEKGSYLAACGIYAAMFDKTPVGLASFGAKVGSVDGGVDKSTALTLQKKAGEYAFDESYTVTEDIFAPENTLRVWAFGGHTMGSYNMLETLALLIETGTGKTVDTDFTYLPHSTTSTTWNAYELFASSARGDITNMTFVSSETGVRVEQELTGNSYDYVLIQTGRDFSLVSGSSAYTNNPIAAAKIAKLAYDNNPNVKIILVAPYGHQATFGDFTNPVIADHSTHVTHINAEAERTKELILSNGYATDVEIVSIGSLFESYSTSASTIKTDLFRAADTETTRKNVGNRANEKGSYLAACALYAAMTGKTPVGVASFGASSSSANGTVSKADAAVLQSKASNYVSGTAVSVDESVYTPAKTLRMWAFGGQMMGSYNMLDTLVELIEAGRNVNVQIDSAFLSHNNGSTTWNAYELFASSARSSLTDFTFANTKAGEQLNNNVYDYVLIQTGRDFSLVAGSSAYNNNPIAAAKIAKLAYENNPNVKIILVAPYGHQATFADFTNPVIADHSTHVTYINAEAQRTMQLILENGWAKNVEILSAGSLFRTYGSAAKVQADLFRAADTDTTRKNVGNRASAQGSYLAACGIYAAMFDQSPIGIARYGAKVGSVDGNISTLTALSMQKLASEYVLKAEHIVPEELKPQADSINIWAFGGQMMGSYNMLTTFTELLKTGTGKTVNIDSAFLGHNNGNTTWNAYELFDSSARGDITNMTFVSSETGVRVEQELNNNSYDYVLIQTGRDFSLVSGSSAYTNNPIAAAKIAKLAYDNNPNVKIILVAPYGHQATWADFTNPVITDHSTHVTYINAEAERTKELILSNGYATDVEIVSIGSLFESYSTSASTIKTDLFRAADTDTTRKNVGNRANEKGSYLAACALYSAVTGDTPVGVASFGANVSSVDGSVSTADALALQKKAGGYMFSETYTATETVFAPENTLRVWAFGGYGLGSHSMIYTLADLLEKGTGKTVDLNAAVLGGDGSSNTWNIYELFASSARGSITDMTFASGTTGQRVAQELTGNAYDYVIIQTGRDYSLIPGSTAKTAMHNPIAAAKIAKFAYANNPNVKIILVAPYGQQTSFAAITGLEADSHAAHVPFINQEAFDAMQLIKDNAYAKNVQVFSLGNLFEYYSRDAETIATDLFRAPDDAQTVGNFANRASKKGAYLAACALYAAMTGNSPVGLNSFGSQVIGYSDGSVSLKTAIDMQNLAARYVLNILSDATKDVFLQDEVYSDEAKALIAAGDAYVNRASYVQYDDTRLVKRNDSLTATYRARRGLQQPELGTAQNLLYTNCACFINNLFNEALGYELVSWNTAQFIERSDMYVIYRNPDGTETNAEKAAMAQEVADSLVPGDLIVYRNEAESNGHIMMYVGNGMMVHSSGGNYNYETLYDNGESYGSIRYDSIFDTILNPENSRYLPVTGRYAVLRPLDLITTGVPQKSVNRMNGMEGIVAQLLTSHPYGNSVSTGENITYTIRITNENSEHAALAVSSVIPAGTTFVSTDGSRSDSTISWNITLHAGRTAELTYTVKVSSGTSAVKQGTTKVNGVDLYSYDIPVKTTLSTSQRASLDSKARTYIGSTSSMSAIIKDAYTAIGKTVTVSENTTMRNSLFTTNTTVSDYLNLKTGITKLASHLYGGYYTVNASHVTDRVQVLKPYMLMTGDVIYVTWNNSGSSSELYLVLENNELLYMTDSGAQILSGSEASVKLASFMGSYGFCVLRPSFDF